MNCKEGDLAVIVQSKCGNAGKVVTCVKLISSPEQLLRDYRIKHNPNTSYPKWEIDKFLPGINIIGEYAKTNIASDCQLRPIRPIPGEEMTDITRQDTPVNSGKEKA